jgi:trafficking protein particle complex subunit 11
VAFQLSLTAPSDVVISALPFSSLAIYFSHKEEPIIVHHTASDTSASKFQRVDLGDLPPEIAVEREGCLRWEKGATILFVGTVSSNVPLTMTVCPYR